MTFDLSNTVCVLTGAVGLLGKEFADGLAECGARLVLTDRSLAECEALEETLRVRHSSADIVSYAADITQPSEVDALRNFVLRRFDRVDALVNNAAVDDKFDDDLQALYMSRFENYPLERWQRMMEVNVTGPFLCSQKLGSLMAERGGGSIVNVASTYGLVAPQQELYRTPEGRQAFFKGAAYPTSKAALIGFTRFLASYWGANGVRVNALCPGGVNNGQSQFFVEEYSKRTPLGRMATPNDYRAALTFLVSSASSYMTGANVVVDGGWTAW